MPAESPGHPVWEEGVWDAIWEDGVWADESAPPGGDSGAIPKIKPVQKIGPCTS